MQEKLALPAQEIPVHGGERAEFKVPSLLAITREDRISVLEEYDHRHPVADCDAWDAIVLHHG